MSLGVGNSVTANSNKTSPLKLETASPPLVAKKLIFLAYTLRMHWSSRKAYNSVHETGDTEN